MNRAKELRKLKKEQIKDNKIRKVGHEHIERPSLFDMLPGEGDRNKTIYLLVRCGVDDKRIAEVLKIHVNTVFNVIKRGF